MLSLPFLWNSYEFLADTLDLNPPSTILKTYIRDAYNKYRPASLGNIESKTNTYDINEDKYEINLDVKEFVTDEIKVKTLKNILIIEAKRKGNREDEHNHLVRKFYIPDWYDIRKTKSSISDDGILTVSVPRNESIKERDVQVERKNIKKNVIKSKL